MSIETGTLLLLFGLSHIPDEPQRCKWCEPNDFDKTINEWLLSDNSESARTVSNIFAYGALPVVAIAGLVVPTLLQQDPDKFFILQDFLIVADSVLLAISLNSLTKVLTARKRPIFYYGRDQTATDNQYGEFLSFFSGHTTLAFATAAASTTVAFLRGYRSAPWLAAGTGLLALTTGIMRIVGDAHWATDALTGMVVGTAIGIFYPLFLHSRKTPRPMEPVISLQPQMTAGPPLLSLSLIWQLFFIYFQ